jgi:2,4-dienoyl-CoA reductase-like NADH-dependent reductase (Old Yellow Enzyme family)
VSRGTRGCEPTLLSPPTSWADPQEPARRGAMCQYSAVDGLADDYHLVHLGRFALGGFGMVMVEATAVTPEGRISHGDLGLWDDRHTGPLARIASFLKENGAVPAIQLAHAGRKGSTRRPWRGEGTVTAADLEDLGDEPSITVAPSALPHASHYAHPAALDQSGIERVQEAFAQAARRALMAGYEVAELHCGHGYLLNQFLSPVANKRTDAYGGSLDNRMRLPLQIARDLRLIWPAASMGSRRTPSQPTMCPLPRALPKPQVSARWRRGSFEPPIRPKLLSGTTVWIWSGWPAGA